MMRTLRNVVIILVVGIGAIFGVVYLSGYAMRNAAAGDETLIYLMAGSLLVLLLGWWVYRTQRTIRRLSREVDKESERASADVPEDQHTE